MFDDSRGMAASHHLHNTQDYEPSTDQQMIQQKIYSAFSLNFSCTFCEYKTHLCRLTQIARGYTLVSFPTVLEESFVIAVVKTRQKWNFRSGCFFSH